MNESETKIGERIRARRMEIGMKAKELAERMGVSAVNVSRWEHSVCEPSLAKLGRIARFLGCSTDYLILGKRNIADVIDRIRDAIRRLLDIIGEDGK